MKRLSVSIIAIACLSGILGARQGLAPAPPSSAATAVSRAIAALGGEARLTSIESISVEAIGHEWALEQSERPEGPWLAQYVQTTELRDAKGERLRRQAQRRNWSFPRWSPDPAQTLIVAGGSAARTDGQRWRPGGPTDLDDALDTFALSPERLLLTARSASDLSLGTPKQLQGVAHHSLTFTWRNRPLTLYLNSWTHRPTMLQMVRDDQWGIWGDVTETRFYSWWDLQDGLWYPRQVTVQWNGLPLRDTTTMAWTVDAPIDEATFAIPAETAAAFAQVKGRPFGLQTLRVDESKAIELSPNVVLLAGSWNVLLLKQPDGVVVIEGPISSQYSEGVIAAAAKRFPGVPIKAVVTTSDAWPHIGGLREYVARKIPVYALDLNVPILDRLVKSTRTNDPDALSRRPVPPQWTPIGSATTIGSGDSRIQLIPVRGELGERMMIAYLPGLKLAYSSDLIQPGQKGGFFMPGMLQEVVAALAREQVATPDRVVGMHLTPTPWQEVEAAVRDAMQRGATARSRN